MGADQHIRNVCFMSAVLLVDFTEFFFMALLQEVKHSLLNMCTES